jgi:hypothetical protein
MAHGASFQGGLRKFEARDVKGMLYYGRQARKTKNNKEWKNQSVLEIYIGTLRRRGRRRPSWP